MGNERKPKALLDLSYQFALKIVKFSRKLQEDKKEYILSKQVLRSGTAIGTLSEEASGLSSENINELQQLKKLLISIIKSSKLRKNG